MKSLSSINLAFADPDFKVPVIQQTEQSSVDLPNSIAGVPEGLVSSLIVHFCVAILFFSIGMEVGRRYKRFQKPIVTQQQHVEILERIWQMTAKRRD